MLYRSAQEGGVQQYVAAPETFETGLPLTPERFVVGVHRPTEPSVFGGGGAHRVLTECEESARDIAGRDAVRAAACIIGSARGLEAM